MKSKIKVTLIMVKTTSTTQHHDIHGSYTTEEVVDSIEYEVSKIQNAITIEWNREEFRIGDRISEKMAKQLAESQTRFDVTVIS